MATPYIGRLVDVGVAKETSKGVGVAPSRWIPKTLFSVEDVAEKVTSEENWGGIWMHGNEELVVGRHAEGEFEMDAGNEIMPLFLLATFGTVSSAAFNSVLKHTFSLQNDNAHDSLTITVIDEVDQRQFENAMVNSWNLSVEVGDLVKNSVSFMSNQSIDTSGHTQTYATDYKFGHQHAHVKIAATTGDLTAATELSLKSLNLTINKNLVLDNILGTVQPIDIINQSFTIEGTISLNFENQTQRNYVLNGTYRALRIDIVNSNITIGSTNPAFRIDLSRVAFFDWSKEQPNDDLVTETLSFRALYDITNANVVNDCYVVNETASY